MSTDSFADFMRRVRAGEAEATAELVREYDPAIRLEVRLRLRDRRLKRTCDSVDVCQSVLASFFKRAAAGQYDLQEPEQLMRLLVTIARNKVAYQARKGTAGRRDHRRVEAGDAAEWELADAAPDPGRQAENDDLVKAFRARLTEEEQRLAELWSQGESWAEIAAALGGSPEARRMQWARVVARVASQLGLDEANHE
jgi:RNA polymerase sigma-70 factor (ECF subfamily)